MTEDSAEENTKTLTNKEWNKLLDALKVIADREKEEQKRFSEEKKIWRVEKWLLIGNLIISSIHLIIAVFKLFKGF